MKSILGLTLAVAALFGLTLGSASAGVNMYMKFEATLVAADGKARTAPVAQDGTFSFDQVSDGAYTLELRGASIEAGKPYRGAYDLELQSGGAAGGGIAARGATKTRSNIQNNRIAAAPTGEVSYKTSVDVSGGRLTGKLKTFVLPHVLEKSGTR